MTQITDEEITSAVKARVDGELRVGLERLAAAAHAYVFSTADGDDNPRVPKDAYCRALTLMRDRGWPPERALIACGRITDSQTRAGSPCPRHEERAANLRASLVDWLLDCYYASVKG